MSEDTYFYGGNGEEAFTTGMNLECYICGEPQNLLTSFGWKVIILVYIEKPIEKAFKKCGAFFLKVISG